MKKQTKILNISILKIIFLMVMMSSMNIFSANMYKVLYVSDGDTVAVKKIENNKETGNLIKVRLYGIDAPELKQDYGYTSKEFLMKLIRGKIVRIEGNKNDRYGRLLGTVYYNNENINEMHGGMKNMIRKIQNLNSFRKMPRKINLVFLQKKGILLHGNLEK